MKTIRNLALAALVLLGCAQAAAAQITQTERERLVAHLEMTSAWFLDEVSSLSPAQLDFKPSPRSWSIRQVIDHLVVVGQIYWDDLQKALKTPMRDRAPASGDAEILLVRHRPELSRDRTRAGESARSTAGPPDRARHLQEASRPAARIREDDHRRSQETLRRASALGRLSVGPADLDPRAAPHPADPGNQGGSEISEEVITRGGRT